MAFSTDFRKIKILSKLISKMILGHYDLKQNISLIVPKQQLVLFSSFSSRGVFLKSDHVGRKPTMSDGMKGWPLNLLQYFIFIVIFLSQFADLMLVLAHINISNYFSLLKRVKDIKNNVWKSPFPSDMQFYLNVFLIF